MFCLCPRFEVSHQERANKGMQPSVLSLQFTSFSFLALRFGLPINQRIVRVAFWVTTNDRKLGPPCSQFGSPLTATGGDMTTRIRLSCQLQSSRSVALAV